MDTATTRLLDLWKAKRGIESDHAAWQALHLSGQSAVSNWRHGRSHAAPALANKMATEAGLDAGQWLALIEADRARSEEDKKTWRLLARRLGAAAAVAVALLPLHPEASPGNARNPLNQQGDSLGLYIMFLRWVARFRTHARSSGMGASSPAHPAWAPAT